MDESPRARPRNYGRRAIGVVLCLSPIAVLTASLVSGLAGKDTAPFAGIWFVAPAAFVAVLNFYLSFVRGLLLRLRHGSLDRYRHVSGIPLIGSLLVLIAGIIGFGAVGTVLSCIVAVALDTGGLPWFLFSTWQDGSFWDS